MQFGVNNLNTTREGIPRPGLYRFGLVRIGLWRFHWRRHGLVMAKPNLFDRSMRTHVPGLLSGPLFAGTFFQPVELYSHAGSKF